MTRRPNCHPDRPHRARGMCKKCYDVEYQRGTHNRHRRATRPAVDFVEDYQFLTSNGLNRDQVAARLGVTRAAVDKALERATRRGLLKAAA